MPICDCDWDRDSDWTFEHSYITECSGGYVICQECNQKIYDGELLEVVIGVKRQSFNCDLDEMPREEEVFHSCKICADVRANLFECGTYGTLWDDVWDALSEDQISAYDLDNLTKVAREKLIPMLETRWEDWVLEVSEGQ